MSEHGNKTGAPGAPPPARTDSGITRRQFMRSTMYGTIGLFTAQALVGAGVMFWPAKVSGFGGKVAVPKKLHEIKPGDPPVMVREGKFYLSRLEDGIIALYWKCVHLGCTVPWNEAEGLFHCPCHGSIYDRTGQNVGGPAPRPLDYMEIAEIRPDGTIIVDTGKIYERQRHEPHHVTKV
ncbi:MAG: Rieske 2Fe-2S domain-containing protein [Bacillota bacterium]|nr:MAG: cytochrome B6 [Bacillota bacterium]